MRSACILWAHVSERLSRCGNLLGALSLAVAGEVEVATEEAVGAGGAAPAALAALLAYDDRRLSIEQLRVIVGLSHSATVRLIDRLSSEGLVERRAGRDARELA